MIAGSGFGLLLLTLPAFGYMRSSADPIATVMLAQIVLGLCVSAIMGALWATVAELFPTRVRYSGMGIAFSFTAALVGGTTPYMAAWLISATGSPNAPAYLLMGSAVITLLTLLTMRETSGQPLID